MRRNRYGVMIIRGLCMAVILAAMLGSGNVLADDVDVYRTSVKNSAMLVIDNSGSMSWPVYDSSHDYANFMEWMLDPAGDGSVAALATDSGNAYPAGAASNAWWDADGTGPTTYDRLVPDRIYLVSSDVGHNLITYTDSGGTTQQVSALGDVMWRTGSDGSNFREEWIKNGIVELKNSAGEYWTLPSVDTSDPAEGSAATLVTSTTIETVQDAGDSKYYVVYPTNTFNIVGGGSVDDSFAGQRLKNAQDTLFVNQVADPRTGTVTDKGFVGTLKTSGYYFSGLFEKSGGGMDFTDNKTNWVSDTVYIFATGKWLNFIKLVEDFNAVTYSAWYNYGFQQTLAWRNICDKSMGTTEPLYTSTSTQILSHDPEVIDYPNTPTGDFEKQPQGAPGTKTTPAIEPPGTVAHIKVRFEYIDTDGCVNNTTADYVDLQDANGNSLLAIKGQQIFAGTAGSGAAVSTDGGVTWTSTNPLDADGYTQAINTTKIRVVWHNGTKSGCSGYDRGFKITGYKYTDQVGTSAGDFLCTNGSSGYGYKIRSRMDVAKSAMKKVVDETKDLLKWGVTSFNTSPRVVKALGGTSSQVITAISSLTPSGGTPLGKALQDAYDDSNYDYYETNSDEAQCAKKYIIAMTDGFPSGDNEWSRISTAKDGNPDFDDVNETYVDNPNDYSNYSDDVAYWLHHEAEHKHTVHSIGFGLDNPLQGDMADSSGGIYVTAFNEGQLVDAFHSLSLSMTSTTSFVAPVVSVDQANRTQSGEDLYTAFFRPAEGDYWIGNLKKYQIKLMVRTECGRSFSEFVVVGSDGNAATDCSGNFKTAAISVWSSVADGGEVDKGGVGARLKDSMPGSHPTNVPAAGPYYDFRNIYTYKNSAMTRFISANVTNTDLDVATDSERYKIVNFIYGYTYAESSANPVAKREWILGDMIHSEPTIIDYLDEDNNLKHRLIVIGSNDGMLHVFVDDVDSTTTTDTTIGGTTYAGGDEVWAFIPPDLVTKLKTFSNPDDHQYFVDGFSRLRRAKTFTDEGLGLATERKTGEYFHKTLVFGERRGGKSYWALEVTKPDPVNSWTVKWQIEGGQGDAFDELKQTWSQPSFATIRTGTGASDLVDVVVFAGGYDPEEDNYPEPWTEDVDDGVFDSVTPETYDDVNGNGSYDYYNPGLDAADTNKNEYGRGIYVARVSDGTALFRATYDTSTVDTGTAQTYPEMKWSFPADPTMIPLSERQLVIYAIDVYANVWKVTYTWDDATTTGTWKTSAVFKSNPGSNHRGSRDLPTQPTLDGVRGRKAFYGPDVSYLGTTWTDDPILYFGTGDRAHPRYVNWDGTNGFHERYYAVTDDADATTAADETNLLNLTCDELETFGDVNQDGTVDAADNPLRTALRDILFGINTSGDVYYPDPSGTEKARGWYRVMGKQGDCTQDTYNHVGEKVLSKTTLFFKIAYFTTFKPTFGDPCSPTGDALLYALDYDFATAALDLNPDNTAGEENLSDTYGVVTNSTIPSSVRVITREGRAAGVFSAGGAIVGAGEKKGTGTTTEIPGPPGGASKMLWETF